MSTWRPSKEEVEQLRGSLDFPEQNIHAQKASAKLKSSLENNDYVHALGAQNGNQAMQMVKAGLKSIYLSGWQTAAGNNTSMQMYPDQSLYPVDSVPKAVQEINNTFRRAAQIDKDGKHDWLCPIVADGEAGFGGPLNVFELTKAMIEAGAAASHWEDQLSSAKKCGHLGGKVLVPATEHIRKLKAARLAAEVCGVPDHIIIARTDANSARLLTNDIDDEDIIFIVDDDGLPVSTNGGRDDVYLANRTSEGFYSITGGIDMAINRGLQYAPYADLLWCETSKPNLEEARKFADAIHAVYPDQMLAYNCSPSFNWKQHLDTVTIAKFQGTLAEMGYKYQFITLAGFHNMNYAMFDLAKSYQVMDMTAYANLQEKEFNSEKYGFTAHKHQAEVGTGYFDLVAQTIDSASSTTALQGSTEEEQFSGDKS